MYRNVIFDFDGVMVDSNEIRIEGFRTLYASESGDKLEVFMKYLRNNHGLSRYRKIRYYYEHVQQQAVKDSTVRQDAERYSYVVAEAVANAPEIPGAEAFLKASAGHFCLALISSSDQQELRGICRRRGIDRYFEAILGSPEEKPTNILNLLRDNGWSREATVYVGDSVSDLEAASSAGVAFIGFGSENFPLSGRDHVIIDNFEQLPPILCGTGRNHELSRRG